MHQYSVGSMSAKTRCDRVYDCGGTTRTRWLELCSVTPNHKLDSVAIAQWQQEFSSLTGKVIHHMHLNGTFSLKRVLTISSLLNTCFVCITIVDSTCLGPRKESGREKIFLGLVQIESKAHRWIWIGTRTRNVFSRTASSVRLVRLQGKIYT